MSTDSRRETITITELDVVHSVVVGSNTAIPMNVHTLSGKSLVSIYKFSIQFSAIDTITNDCRRCSRS